MEMTLESLGFTKEELQERVVEMIADRVMAGTEIYIDPDTGATEESVGDSEFGKKIKGLVKRRIDDAIRELGEKHVLPNVSQYVENLTLQTTNEWGEKKGASVTFVEYLVQRAEAYMQEKVSFDGKSKADSGGYSWSGAQTRITYLVHQHLHYSIETAMKAALQAGLGEIAKGISETAKLKLNEIAASMKVNVTTK